MEIASLVLTIISTIAAVVSAGEALSVNSQVKKLNNKISGNRNIQNSGKISVKNQGDNQGIISGVNAGEIRK